jgi:uncharacterized membrane protein YccC
MLVTSVSLPQGEAVLWRRNQRVMMRMAVRALRLQMRQHPIRRGVKRRYNRAEMDFVIVTTRFTEAEYDALHAAASAMRVSVSLLVHRIIQLWQKPSRRRENTHLTNYVLLPGVWNENAGVFTETLWFWRKPTGEPIYPRLPQSHYSSPQQYY